MSTQDAFTSTVAPFSLHGQTEVSAMAFSPDGTQFVSVGSAGTLKFYEADTGAFLRELTSFEKSGMVREVSFSPNGKQVVLMACFHNQQAEVHVWDLESGKPLHRFGVPLDVEGSARFSLDGTKVICSGRTAKKKGVYCVWNAQTGQEEVNLERLGSPLANVIFSPDGRWVLCVGELSNSTGQQTIVLRDSVKAKKLKTHESPWPYRGKFSPDSLRIASNHIDGKTHIWDVASWQEFAAFDGAFVAFTPDSTRVVCLRDREGSTQSQPMLKYVVYDAATGAIVADLGDSGPVVGWGAGAISPDGARVLGTTPQGRQDVYDLKTGTRITAVKPHRNRANRANYSPDGTRIVVGGDSGIIELFDAHSFQFLRCMRDSDDMVSSITFSPDGKKLCCTYSRGKASLWDVATGDRIAAMDVSENGTSDAAFSPDGKQIVTASRDLLLKFWDAETGKKITAAIGADWGAGAVSYRPDGKRFLCGGRGVEIWDAVANERLTEISAKMPDHGFQVLRYSPDGSQVFGVFQSSAGLWNAETGEEVRKFAASGAMAYAGALSPDGARVATGFHEGSIVIWDAATGKSLKTIKGHKEMVSTLVFSPDSARLLSGGNDGNLKVWDAAAGELLAVL